MYRYHGKILHGDLGSRTTTIEEPDELFYRLYAGDGLLGAFCLLKKTKPGIDPLSPDNLLIFSNRVIAGYPSAGLVRYFVTAKSSLTLDIGETRCEGRWAVSLEKSGFDAPNFWSGADALGYCIFAIAPTHTGYLEIMTNLLAVITGWETSSYEIIRWGDPRNHGLRVDNNREGLSPADDWLPDRCFDEPIDSGAKKGIKLDREAIATYHEMMGWDEQGLAYPATPYDHHLDWTVDV